MVDPEKKEDLAKKRSDESATVHEGMGTGGECQVDGAAGRGAGTHQILEWCIDGFRMTGGVDQFDDVLTHCGIDVDLVHEFS